MDLAFLKKFIRSNDLESEFTYLKSDRLISYRPRPFSTLEVELTTRCNLFCPPCPRVTYRRSWIERDMSLDSFEKISAAFDRFETIHFRGWGEPLLNQSFPEMVSLAYKSGARLVLSTNGVEGLDPGLAPYFDAVIFRLDSGLASSYERRNPAARFNRAIFNISRLLYWREVNKAVRPSVVILLAKNKYSLNELPAYLDLVIRLGPDRVVFYQPFFHVRPVDDEAFLPAGIDPALIYKVDRILVSMARSAGLDMVNQTVDGNLGFECARDPERDLFVNSSGRAAPCRFAALPLAGGNFSRFEGGREWFLKTAVFGSLLESSLEETLEDRVFREFRRTCRRQSWSQAETDAQDGLKPGSTSQGERVLFLSDTNPKVRLCGLTRPAE